MDSVLEIEEAIKRLPREQIFQLVERLQKDVSDAWDRQFEEDVFSGRLDSVARQAVAEHRAGHSTGFPQDAE